MTIKIEQETSIVFNATEDSALVWSASPVFLKRMEKLGVEPYQVGRRGEHGESRAYRVPKKWVKVHPPRQPRQLSPEQLARARENARFHLRRPRFDKAGDPIARNTAQDLGSEGIG